MAADYHVHGLGHDGPPHTVERLWPYVEVARARGLTEIGFAEHEWYLEGLDFSVFPRLEEKTKLKVRAGLEVDFRPGRDFKELEGKPWDYLIGSVHEVHGWAFDKPGEEEGFGNWDIDELYRLYFGLAAQAAATGIFQVIGHLDLIKLYGHRPRRPAVELAEPALQLMARLGIVLEVNTSGLYRPVREIYPSRDILERAFQLNIPVIITSDAHVPEEVGRARETARQILYQIGYRQLATFHKGHMGTEPL